MLRYLDKKAQSTAEYVLILGIIVGAVMLMQHEVKRGFQGRIKDAIEYVDQGEQNSGVVQFSGSQYEPGYVESNFDTTRSNEEGEQLLTGGAVEKNITKEHSERTGHQTIGLGDAEAE